MAGIFLEAGNINYTVVNTGDYVFGSTATEAIQIDGAARSITVNSTTETVDFASAVSAYTFKQVGNQLEVAKDGTVVATIGIDEDGSNVSFSGGSDMLVKIGVNNTGVMSIGGNDITTSAAALTIAVEATEINSANDATEDFVDYSSATVISGLANDIGTMLTEKGTSGNKIGLADDVALILTDTSVSTSDLDSIVQATTGAVTATITSAGVTATLGAITHVNTSDIITFATNDTTAVDASDLVDLKALVDTYTEGTTINALTEAYDTTDLTTEITNALAIATGTAETVAITDGAISAANADIIANATTGIVTAIVTATGDIATLNSALGNATATDALTMELDETSLTAAELNTLDGKTSVNINSDTVETIESSNVADVKTLVITNKTTSGIDDDWTVTLADTTIAAADVKLVNDAGSGAITLSATTINGTVSDLLEIVNDTNAAFTTETDYAVTLSDTASIADYNTIDDDTTGVITTSVAALDSTTDTFVLNNNILTITNDFLNGTDQLSFVGAGSGSQEGTLTEVAVTNASDSTNRLLA